MKLTVLIDLDDTLLTNDMGIFLKAYLKSLGNALSPYVPAEKMIPQLLSATDKMTIKTSPQLTLEETFDNWFYPFLGLKKSELTEPIRRFYEEDFPTIQKLTSPRDQAIKLIEKIISSGCEVVIATNPVFPKSAVLQKIFWAGLKAYLPQFTGITSYENFHFAKPNPTYYAEILGQLGWPDQPAVMIGNSITEDILPASKLGMPVFWLNDNSESLPQSVNGLSKTGSLDEVFPWLQKVASQGALLEIKDPSGMLAVLNSTPAAFETICSKMDQEQWKHNPDQNEWSPTEIMCHMRDVDLDVNLKRLPVIITEQNPFLPAVDSDHWAIERSYSTQDGPGALKEFMNNRIRLVELLGSLPEDGWNAPARHAIFGPTSLHELVSIIISHDQAHLKQIVKNVIV